MRCVVFIFLFVCLGIALWSFCQPFSDRDIAFLGKPSSGPSYLIKQDFEGTGYDNGETWTESGSTIDEDNTVIVLDGSQSLLFTQVASTTQIVNSDFTAQDEIWVYAKFRIAVIDLGANRNIIGVRTSGGSTFAAVQLTTTGTLRAVINTVAATVNTVTTDTTYHLWFHYKKGTGADAVADVGFSIDGVRPTSGNGFAQLTDGNATVQAAQVIVGGGSASTQTIAWDKVRADDVVIGSNPP